MIFFMNKYLTRFFIVCLLISFNVNSDESVTDCLKLIKENQCIEAINVCSIYAEKGDPRAQMSLGFLYSGTRHGDFRRNYKQSFAWMSKAADQGFTKAELAIAEMYMGGEVVPLNAKKAKAWYEKVAEKGNLDGINGIARLYRYGTGVRKNYETSFKLYEQAALQGHTRSQVGLGLSYRDAKGVKKNLVKAYAWLLIASEKVDDRKFKDLEKAFKKESEEIDKTIPNCKYVLSSNEFGERFAIGYAKRLLLDLKKRMSAKQTKKAKALAIELKASIT